MYEDQFGLNKRPFRALATGSEVFVGPQTAAAMAGLKKALTSPDAVVAVGGPVGVGKTTVVRRALDAIGENPVVIWVGRMQLGHDEVLELLLEEMGVELPSGTVQRFTRFRRQLKRYAEEGSRVFVVVEDVSRMGSDALSELEALTATDAGVSEGANIVLMGGEEIDSKLKDPALARLRQRLRLRQNIVPLGRAELLGYLKHCFRLAGKEFDQLFENGTADVLHRLSGGIPRVANNLVESSLISAAENRLDRVNVAQIKLVASEEYDLSVTGICEAPPLPDRDMPSVAEPAAESELPAAPTPQLQPDPMVATPEPALSQAAPEPAPPLTYETGETPITPNAESTANAENDDEIPDLIQDTLPDLEVLAPDLVTSSRQEPAGKPVEKQTGPRETHSPAAEDQLTAAQVEKPGVETPEWERDPTLAQLRPDLDALEQAMAVAQGLKPDPEAADDSSEVASKDTPEVVPEITLDREIQAKVDRAAEQLRLEAERRAAAEAEKEKESGVDNRSTSEILAAVREKQTQPTEMPDNSVEAQFDARVPTLTPTVDSEDLHAASDTVHELPVLSDSTDPSFEPAAHRNPQPAAEPAPVMEPENQPAPESGMAFEPDPDRQPDPEPEPLMELELEPEAGAETETEAEAETETDPAVLEQARKADAELERIASNLAQAKSIDDCDDKMAETLFGEEFSMMAAQVAAMAPPELTAADESESSVKAANDDAEANGFAPLSDFDEAAAINVELDSESESAGRMDTSASQRLATVRALNASSAGPTGDGSAMRQMNTQPAPSEPQQQPQSIEDQINTSMTQTLKTLSVRPDAGNDSDEEDGKSKGGFFSRFRR